jgi:hypothetical protein
VPLLLLVTTELNLSPFALDDSELDDASRKLEKREGGCPRSAAAAVDVLEGHICQGRARGPVVLQDGPPGTHARGVTPPSRR